MAILIILSASFFSPFSLKTLDKPVSDHIFSHCSFTCFALQIETMVKLYLFLLAFAATLATNSAFTLTVPTKLGSSTTFSAPTKIDSSTALSYYGTIAPHRSGYGYGYGTSYNDRPYFNRYEADGAYDMYGDYYSGGYNTRGMSTYRYVLHTF